MSYFRELPNIKYPSFLSDKNSSLEFIDVKNFFRRVKLREDLQNTLTIFNKYEIPMGDRPDNVAENLYGSAELDWVVVTCAGIINIRDEWPLNSAEIYDFSLRKYGTALDDMRYYETKEIRDSEGHLVLPKGKRVNSNFTVKFLEIPLIVAYSFHFFFKYSVKKSLKILQIYSNFL